jgi:hypothetical protein
VEIQENLLLRFEEEGETYYKFNELMNSKHRIIRYDQVGEEQEEEQLPFHRNKLGRQR